MEARRLATLPPKASKSDSTSGVPTRPPWGASRLRDSAGFQPDFAVRQVTTRVVE